MAGVGRWKGGMGAGRQLDGAWTCGRRASASTTGDRWPSRTRYAAASVGGLVRRETDAWQDKCVGCFLESRDRGRNHEGIPHRAPGDHDADAPGPAITLSVFRRKDIPAGADIPREKAGDPFDFARIGDSLIALRRGPPVHADIVRPGVEKQTAEILRRKRIA